MSDWIVQHCCTKVIRMIGEKEETFRCQTAIRVPIGQQESVPVCKWCLAGTAYHLDRTWPAGMPNPDNPWPWLTDQERARKIRISYWQDRFKEYGQYATLAARRA
jgi:hypothetical protein